MYLFDIDGTLLLTGGAGSRAINAVFQQRYGLREVMSQVSAGGKTDDMILQECAKGLGRDLSADELQELLAAYLPRLQTELAADHGFRLMPYVHECLEFLAGEDMVLGIATGNIEAAALAKLMRAGLHETFHFGGYGSDSPRRPELVARAMERGRALAKRHLRDEEFVVVGDTLHDIYAARECGARVLAVATGSVSFEVLEAAEPDAVFRSLEELPAWHRSSFELL